MHGHMAANAFAAGLEPQAAVRNPLLCVVSGMALQAELAAFATHQKHAIGASVRIVAGNASFHFDRGMLVDKRPALLRMAIHAGFRSWLVQAGHVLRTVRVVAVRTLHQSFRNAMVVGQRKLRLNRLVAGGAKSRLGLL